MPAKDNWYQLPPDMNAWNSAILDNISMKVPEITNYIAGLEWNKLDPATGDGDGVIQLLNGMCAAPITIRSGRLAPIDVIASNYGSEPKFYPLTSTFLQKIYADNVIGEPVDKGRDDSDFEGPGFKVKHFKTVDAIKYATAEAANNVLDTIIKSASVANWMTKNMPELLVELGNKATEVNEKLANTKDDLELPDLMVVWKEGSNFYANNNLIDADTVDTFCKLANATIEERTGLMNGTPIVRDFREKIAAIHIPTEQDIIASDLEDNTLFDDVSEKKSDSPDIAVTTAYLKDGSSRRGIVLRPRVLDVKGPYLKDTEKNINPQDATPEISPVDKNIYDRELFICSEGYGLNCNIKTDARISISENMLLDLSTPSEVAIGMVGMFAGGYSRINFGRVEDVILAGNSKYIRYYDLINHRLDTVRLGGNSGIQFYEVPDERLDLVNNSERTNYVSLTGINGILRLNSDGRLVLDGESYSVVNCPFAIMNKYAAAYEDAMKIANIARKYGECQFEVFPVKEAAVSSGQEDRTKSNKNTKSGTDDEVLSIPQVNPGLATTTPEAMLSVDLENDPNYGFGTGNPVVNGAAEPAGSAAQPQGAIAGYTNPISSKDLENVVTLNSPKVMDAYVMAGLAQNGLASQENMMKANDVIIEALEHLSKILFLSRQGQMDFVNEQDIQAAMQKLTDVAESLGLQAQRIGQ